MTRKCVLCKETNYKNTYSFFSAPKDAETRKKWECALGIDNYSVTDETYVCSKHFHKEDIVTHWVSGVPPHVITIKYKKCRLRPGAVPGKHLNETNHTNPDCSADCDINMSDYLMFNAVAEEGRRKLERRALAMAKGEEARRRIKLKELEARERTETEYCFSTQFENPSYKPKDWQGKRLLYKMHDANNRVIKSESEKPGINEEKRSHKSYSELCIKRKRRFRKESIESLGLSQSFEQNPIEDNEPIDTDVMRSRSRSRSSEGLAISGTLSCHLSGHSDLEDTSIEMWETETDGNERFSNLQESLTDKNIESSMEATRSNGEPRTEEDNDLVDTDRCDSTYIQQNSEYDNEDGEMLFEDLLEVCNEIMLPRGWSCLVTSKGRRTTVVYLYMGMTKSGMPFPEKQVFVKSDLKLRCAAVNREINPVIHNLIRDGKNLKVHTLLDVEELIDEFDQRTVCQGIYGIEGSKNSHKVDVICKDGVNWRHEHCPLILNSDSSRCTKCMTLSHNLLRQSSTHLSPSNRQSFSKKQQKKFPALDQLWKRTRKYDRRYSFIKIY